MVMENVVETENNNKNHVSKKWFLLQWHLTARCDQRCKHCYVNDVKTYEKEIENEIPLLDCIRVIDSFVYFCQLTDAQPGIVFTGGDPFIRSDFFDILKYAYQQGISTKMMGNPFHLDSSTISYLQKLGVWSYQLSLDGMEKVHDWVRGPGSFRATIQALHLLKVKRMRTVVMFTLSKHNVDDLLEVMTLVSKIGVDVFAFARLAKPCSDRHYFDKRDLSPQEYRNLLLKVQDYTKILLKMGSRTHFNRKDNLWKLLLYEQGKWKPRSNPHSQIISGCHIGRSSMTILADGTVFACRRFYSPVGNLPNQSILDVFISDKLEKYRHPERFEKCFSCPLLYYCRGCPAIAFSYSNNYYAPDPQCWRE